MAEDSGVSVTDGQVRYVLPKNAKKHVSMAIENVTLSAMFFNFTIADDSELHE